MLKKFKKVIFTWNHLFMNLNIHKNIFFLNVQHFKMIVYVKLIMSLNLLTPEKVKIIVQF